MSTCFGYVCFCFTGLPQLEQLQADVKKLARGQAFQWHLFAEAFPVRRSTQPSSSSGSGASCTKRKQEKEQRQRVETARRKAEKKAFDRAVEDYYHVRGF